MGHLAYFELGLAALKLFETLTRENRDPTEEEKQVINAKLDAAGVRLYGPSTPPPAFNEGSSTS